MKRKSPLPTTTEQYIAYQDRQGFKIGDAVQLTRAAEDHEHGWLNNWLSHMNDGIGITGTITHLYGKYGIQVNFPGVPYTFRYPYFILKKVPNET